VPELTPLRGGDGSFSLHSTRFGEGFHAADGALREAQVSFVAPAELHRFPAGSTLRVVEVAVGTGTNTAALIAAAGAAGVELEWWGLEADPEPLRIALGEPPFRRQWPAPVIARLEAWAGGPRLLWGDARRRLGELPEPLLGSCDLVLLDAFSPRRCPELWTLDFLGRLARLLSPRGRLVTYCAAAAVRSALRDLGLHLASVVPPGPATAGERSPAGGRWSRGTVASPAPLPSSPWLGPLAAMERDHLASRAAVPYRDPTQDATAGEILAAREREVRGSTAPSGGSWRRRWGIGRGR
jgi:tRNA U34 5-methylaminomethyl-2-thiouridine-forming methyltransferase MnmC